MRFLIYLAIVIIISSCNSIPIEEINSDLTKNEIDRLGQLVDFYHADRFNLVIDSGRVFTYEYPQNDIGFHLMSSAYLVLGMDSLAWEYAEKTLAINPENNVAILNKAILFDKKEEYNKAKDYYEESLRIDPTLAQAYSNYSANRLKVKDYENAVALMEKSVELANQTSDKGILCMLYHKTEQFHKRDSLFSELETLNYVNLEKLKEIIYE